MSDEASNRRALRAVGRRLEGLDLDRCECFDEVFDGASFVRCSSHGADFLRASLREAVELQLSGARA